MQGQFTSGFPVGFECFVNAILAWPATATILDHKCTRVLCFLISTQLLLASWQVTDASICSCSSASLAASHSLPGQSSEAGARRRGSNKQCT